MKVQISIDGNPSSACDPINDGYYILAAKRIAAALMAKHLIKCRKDIYRACCLNGIHCLQEGKII